MSKLPLNRQLVSNPNFRWIPGMLGYSAKMGRYQRFVYVGVWVDTVYGLVQAVPYSDPIPEIVDASTQGALLHLVQDAYKAPHAYVKWDAMTGEWLVGGLPDLKIVRGPSAGEVLAKALLEAP